MADQLTDEQLDELKRLRAALPSGSVLSAIEWFCDEFSGQYDLHIDKIEAWLLRVEAARNRGGAMTTEQKIGCVLAPDHDGPCYVGTRTIDCDEGQRRVEIAKLRVENEHLLLDIAELRRDVERLQRDVEARPEITPHQAAVFIDWEAERDMVTFEEAQGAVYDAMHAHARKAGE